MTMKSMSLAATSSPFAIDPWTNAASTRSASGASASRRTSASANVLIAKARGSPDASGRAGSRCTAPEPEPAIGESASYP